MPRTKRLSAAAKKARKKSSYLHAQVADDVFPPPDSSDLQQSSMESSVPSTGHSKGRRPSVLVTPRSKRRRAAINSVKAASRKSSEVPSTSESPAVVRTSVESSALSTGQHARRKRHSRSITVLTRQKKQYNRGRVRPFQYSFGSRYVPGSSFYYYLRDYMVRKYANNSAYRNRWSARMREKYRQNSGFRNQWSVRMREKYRQNSGFRNQWSVRMREKMRENYRHNVEFRNQWMVRMRVYRRRMYRENTEFRDKWKKSMRHHYAQSEASREKTKDRVRCYDRKKAADSTFREQRQQKQRNARASADPVEVFTRHIQEGPIYTCVSCHRHLYRQSVVQFHQTRYRAATQDMLTRMLMAYNGPDSQFYICKTCRSYIVRCKIPPQSSINGLELDDMPESLRLTELESALVGQRVPFMKVLALPRGRQRAIHGAVVNVPSNVCSTVTSLPLTPGQAGLMPLKLKRRLSYKGYVMREFVRPNAVLRAVSYLVENNPLYCGMDIDKRWNEACLDEDHETWTSLTGAQKQDLTHDLDDVEPSDSDTGSDSSSEDDDDVMQKVQGLKFSTCLQPSDPEYAATELCVAPAEGRSPLDFMLDQNCEILAFPCKFPLGKGGFTDEREISLTPKKYFVQRLLNKDKRFASDASYLFFSQFVTENKCIRDQITVAMRMTSGRISASTVSDAERLRELIRCDNAYQFLQNVRGSPAYFQRAVKQLLAMCSQLGCPQFFVTLSAADLQWAELYRIIALQDGRTISDEEIEALSFEQKTTMLRNDPVLAARHFDHRLKAFFTDILVHASVLGQVKEYFYRVEFQMRGSPHAHCLMWMADGPDMSTANKEEIETYFSGKVVGDLPPESDKLHPFVDRLQRHSHSVACRKGQQKGKQKGACRFNFPRPPSDRTMLAEPPSVEENTAELQKWRDDLLQRVQDVLDNVEDCASVTLDDILHQAGISSDDYHRALAMNMKGRSLVLKRRPCDMNVNNYNATMLLAWQANMDIQPVLDVYACIMYIVSYMNKDEKNMGEILRAAKRENADKDVRSQMKKIGSVFLTHREVSAQEAVFRLLGLTMLQCTVKRVFVPTEMPENRVRILKASRHLQTLDPDSEDVFMTGLVQRYMARPSSLEQMCLADFAVEYDVCYKSKKDDNDDDDIQATPMPSTQKTHDSIIKLNDGMGTMRHRKTRAILMSHRFSSETEPEKHYHAELMLYTAWRNEERDLLGNFDTYSESYASQEDEVSRVKHQFYHYSESLLEAANDVLNNGPPLSAWDALASHQRQENMASIEEGAVPESFVDCSDDAILQTTFVDTTAADATASTVTTERLSTMSDDDFYNLTRSLNRRQQYVFQFVLDWCRAKRRCVTTPPFFVFCSGGAGVGKSHLIHAVVQMATRELRRLGDSPDDVIVDLAAPTGTAAYNVGGSTIHSAFLMSSSSTDGLSAEKLAKLRNKYGKLQLLILDEISMCGSNLLKRIHERLAAISGLPSASPFAGVSVFAVGDFQQLSPVGEPPVYKAPKSGYIALAQLWMSNFKVVELTEIMRQQSDSDFAQLLSRVRVGAHTPDDIDVLKSRQLVAEEDDTAYDDHPHIYARNADVDLYNERRLNSISAASVTIQAKDKWPAVYKQHLPGDLENRSGLATLLTLKVHSRVLLLRNVSTEQGLFNGALGRITAFLPEGVPMPTAVAVLFDNERLQQMSKEKYPSLNGAYPVERVEVRIPLRHRNSFIEATRLQFPLKVAFAMTIHKCQGQTLNSVVVSLKGHFGPGQAYVALSRCKTMQSLFLSDFDAKCIKVNRSGLQALETMKQEQPLPIPHEAFLSDLADTLRVSCLNTRSLQRHAGDINNSIYLAVCDVAVFTETRVRANAIPAEFSRFHVFCASAPHERNYIGGVAVMVSQDCTTEEVFSVVRSKFQLMIVRVARGQHDVNIAALYRSPQMPISEFQDIINRYIQPTIDQNVRPTLLLGDFNINAREKTALPNLAQYVTNATHTDGATLDHVYWTGRNTEIATDVISCHWSDHNIVAVRIGEHISTTASDVTVETPDKLQPPVVPVISELSPQPSTSAETVKPRRQRNAAAYSSTVAVSRSTVISSACSFLDGALGPNRVHLDLDVPVEDFIHQHGLRIRKAPGNGHCLLHAWAVATKSSVTNVRQQVLDEYNANAGNYQQAGVQLRELQRYVRERNYHLAAVDAVLNMLCNAYRLTAFIIGQKFDYRNQRNVVAVSGVMEIRRISSIHGQAVPATVLLLKTGEHYDCIV